MSIRAQRISFGLAVLPFLAAALCALIAGDPAILLVAVSGMLAIFLLLAHVILAPISSFVTGLERVADGAGAPAEILAAMPPESVAVLALVAHDAGAALHTAASDAAGALHSAAAGTLAAPGEPDAEWLGGPEHNFRRVA